MEFFSLFFKNIFNSPLVCFFIGFFISLIKIPFKIPQAINKFLTLYILFCIGLKGGGPFIEHAVSSTSLFIILLGSLVMWGLLQPLLSFGLLRTFTRVDPSTAAAISASFGSVSVMTFVTAVSFLEGLQVQYQELMIAILAIMEIPAIISGIFLAKTFDKSQVNPSCNFKKILKESLLNKAILSIGIGFILGTILYMNQLEAVKNDVLLFFKPLLCLFLFNMGLHVGLNRPHFRLFSWSLNLFGIYMPLIGAGFGLFLSYFLGLDVGTSTLVAVLTASASYIAVPAAMRIALPQAKEAIYLPLSVGIAFPFNVIIGIPVYYHLARLILS